MAQLAAPSPPERLSQILPSVKCSNCGHPVPLSELGEHVCAPHTQPPLPVPSSTSSTRPTPPPTAQPPPVPRASPSQAILARIRSDSQSSVRPPPLQLAPPSKIQTFQPPPSPGRLHGHANPPPSPLSRQRSPAQDQYPFPNVGLHTPSGPSPSLGPSRSQTPLSSAASTLARDSLSDVNSINFPSSPDFLQSNTTSQVTNVPSQILPQAMRRPSDAGSFRQPYSKTITPPPRSHSRMSSTRSQHSSHSGNRRPSDAASIRPASRTPPISSQRHPSNASIDPPSLPQSGPFPQSQMTARNGSPAPSIRRPSTASSTKRPLDATHNLQANVFPNYPYSRNGTPTPDALHPLGSRSPRLPNDSYVPSPGSATPQMIPHLPMDYTIDTKSGGEAGMAGVGRRAFHAAAHAAMFAVRHTADDQLRASPALSIGDRRGNTPGLLQIFHHDHGRGTPPLSPNSTLSPHSPRSPLSQQSLSPTIPAASYPSVASSPLPSGSITPRAVTPQSAATVKDILTQEPALISSASAKEEVGVDIIAPFSPGSEASFRGLAYDDDSDEDDDGDSMIDPNSSISSAHARASALRPSKSDSSAFRYSRRLNLVSTQEQKVPFPSTETSGDSPATPFEIQSTASKTRPVRSDSASSAHSALSSSSSVYSRSTAKSTGALTRAMETLFENNDGDSKDEGSSAFDALQKLTVNTAHPEVPEKAGIEEPPVDQETAADVHSHETARESQKDRPVKFPTRSHTTPSLLSPKSDVKPLRRPRMCIQCHTRIENGRWIKEENGSGVLCGRCWKSKYLPKCYRCDKPIETQVVSSRDGQLKGKYHRACFNCHTCHSPFPDKEFYVLDGNPYCAYHYHEANKSLCNLKTCGQPIEGPCAVSHSGARYHPNCFICEYRDAASIRCTEQLDEYWEVDGKRLCYRHHAASFEYADIHSTVMKDTSTNATTANHDGNDSDGTRTGKRVTRFIDLR